jgi:hypothetical protein
MRDSHPIPNKAMRRQTRQPDHNRMLKCAAATSSPTNRQGSAAIKKSFSFEMHAFYRDHTYFRDRMLRMLKRVALCVSSGTQVPVRKTGRGDCLCFVHGNVHMLNECLNGNHAIKVAAFCLHGFYVAPAFVTFAFVMPYSMHVYHYL